MSKAKRKKKTEAKPAPEEAVVAPETTAEAPAEPQPLDDTPVDGAVDEAVVAAEDGVAPAEAEQIDESENPPGAEAPAAEGEEPAEGEASEAAPAEGDAAEGEAVGGEAAEEDAPLGPKWELAQVVQAILFASQKPVSPKELRNILKGAAEAEEENLSVKAFAKVKEDQLREAIEVLENRCADPQNAYEVRESAAGWQLVTKPEYAPWLRQLFPENRPARLSAPALETLAIIAYRQPITRADIEAVRGVAVDGVMQTLLDRGLVKIAGRAEIPGRPLLYETTSGFMEHFGLKNLDDLPNAGELRKIALPTAPIPEAPGAAKPAETPAPTADAPAPEAAPAAAEGASEAVQEASVAGETGTGAEESPGETPEASPEPAAPSEPVAEISDAGEVASEPAPTDAVESDQPVVEVAEAEAPSEASVDETEPFNDTESESQK